MSLGRLNLQKVVYQRSYVSIRSIPVCIVGDSRWARDVELLLEDNWRNFYCASSPQELPSLIAEKAPALFLVEAKPYGDSEQRYIESVLPKGSHKIVVSHENSDPLEWSRTKRYCASQQIPSLELSASPQEAAKELEEVLDGLVSADLLDISQDIRLVRQAYAGFIIGAQTSDDSSLSIIFNVLASRFTMDERELQAATALADTYKLWTSIKDVDDLHLAYLRLTECVSNRPVEKLVRLANELRNYAENVGDLPEEVWEKVLKRADLGIMTRRDLERQYEIVRNALSQASTKARKWMLRLA